MFHFKICTLILLSFLFKGVEGVSAKTENLVKISDSGSARATAYTMSSKIIRSGDVTHVTYLGFKEKVYVKSLSHKTGSWSSPVYIGQAVDNHGAPTLAIDSRGYLHIVYGPHHGPFKYRVSSKPNDASSWTSESEFGVLGTYASVVIDAKDVMHVVYRGAGGGSYYRNLMYQRREIYSNSKASEWSKPLALVEGGNYSVAYDSSIRIGHDQSLNIGFLFFDHSGSSGGRRIGFMKSRDGGKSWQKMNGEVYSLPVTYNSTHVVSDSAEVDFRLSNVSLDSQGNAFMAINRMKARTKVTSIIKLTNSGKVQHVDLMDFLDSNEEYDAYSATTIDSQDRLWIAAPVVREGDSWGGNSTKVKVLRMEKDGTIKLITTLSDTSSKPEAYWLPVFEHFNGHNDISASPGLLFTHGYGNRSHSLGTAFETSVLFKSKW